MSVTDIDVKDAHGDIKNVSIPAARATTNASADAVLGATSGAKVVTDANGTIQQYLRGLVTFFANALGAGTSTAAIRVTLSSDGPAVATLGNPTDAKSTSTDGTSTTHTSILKQISASVQSLFTLHGAATDAKNSATDATSLTFMQVLKQISASVQTFAGNNVDVIGPDATFTIPSATQYATGEAVSNNATPGSVVAVAFTVTAAKLSIVGGRIKKSSTSVTSASFRMHLYTADPTTSTGIVNGDNAAFSTKVGSYVGAIDINVDIAFSDAAYGRGGPRVGNSIPVNIASGLKVYGLLEARDTYTPTNGETVTCSIEVVY